MKIKILSAVILCASSMQVSADVEGRYWSGSDGDYARGRDGKCVRTILWSAEHALPGCEGGEMKAHSHDKPVVKKKTVAKKEKPVVKPKPVVKTVAAPQYTNLRLASGATFKTGGSTLSSTGKAEVAALIAKFDGETVDSVVVEGYTDDRGAASFNQQLSEKRASAVKTELIANGVDANKIRVIGYGEANPIATNNTRAGRAQNRRVIIKIDGKQREL